MGLGGLSIFTWKPLLTRLAEVGKAQEDTFTNWESFHYTDDKSLFMQQLNYQELFKLHSAIKPVGC